jgi:hypothetical protein
MTKSLSLEQKYAVSRISGLVIINAMIFQEVLSDHNKKVQPLQKILNGQNIQNEFCEHWRFIVKEINYYSIFHVASEILDNITTSKGVLEALKSMALTAQRIIGMRAALRHDLMGRIYHRLLAEKKYLGTYYTSIPAATLLLRLAMRAKDWQIDWYNIASLEKFTVADLACGTGTLLMAAADSITDNYVNATAAIGTKIDINCLQNALNEKVIYGYDVLASATHLTASTLALRTPEIAFTKMNLYCLPFGGSDHRLGSIEFSVGSQIGLSLDLFGAKQVKGSAFEEAPSASLPNLDLCVMNPPFTRSVGGNLLFGSLPITERKPMQKKLGKIARQPGFSANITAGLGSVFVAVADPYIKPKGRIALVLPKALLSGVSWGPTRELINKGYEIEYIVSSHDPNRWNFSESTSLSEVLVVAKKGNSSAKTDHKITVINLWRNPTTSFEALAVGQSVMTGEAPDIKSGQGALEISLGKEKMGEAVSESWEIFKKRPNWMLPSAFAQNDLIRVTDYLMDMKLWLPGEGRKGEIPLVSLGTICTLGPDRRDIHDGFTVSKSPTSFQAYWGHEAKTNITMGQKPNAFLSPLNKAKKGRSLRKKEDLWPLAGKILISERMRLNTQGIAAIRVSERVLSNMWWPMSLRDKYSSIKNEKIITLWLNSTLGLLILFAHRLETEGPWVEFKKPVLSSMPVLDLGSLSPKKRDVLASAFDRISKMPLQPYPNIEMDPVRKEIDKTIAHTFELPDLSVLRSLLSREPIISLQRLV